MATWYSLRCGFKQEDGAPSHNYELTKWDDHEKQPLETYVIALPRGRFLYCNCPSPRKPCKHYEIAQNLLSAVEASDGLQLHDVIWQDDHKVLTRDM